VPYAYGGNTPAGIDCSGLVQYVFGRLGVALPRTTNEQYRATMHVPKDQAQPGDIIFLPDGSGNIYHDGIYAGGGDWWVARHSGTVVTRQALWTSNYVVGRINPPPGANTLPDAIQATFDRLGGPGGLLGFPTTPELPTPDRIGAFRHYAAGSIYWSPASGAHEVHGAIRAEWAALGWETGFLRYPVTDELPTPDRVGRFNYFQGGGVYWTPATGPHEVHGAILAKWASLGWESGSLRYPVTDELPTPDRVGRFNYFQGGGVYWTPATGPHVVSGAILARWAALGWERSSLGYPVSDPYAVPGGVRSDFQHGSLVYDSSTQLVNVLVR